MNRDEINYRLQILHDALQDDSRLKEVGKVGIFTTFERICVNQERGYLYSELSYLVEVEPPPLRPYKIPEHIQLKIRKSYN